MTSPVTTSSMESSSLPLELLAGLLPPDHPPGRLCPLYPGGGFESP
jgi:hypothetical protein